jgi:NmrA-like family
MTSYDGDRSGMTNEKLIAVIAATGLQGGAVVRALQASGEFKVRALTRNPGKHRDLIQMCVASTWGTLPKSGTSIGQMSRGGLCRVSWSVSGRLS